FFARQQLVQRTIPLLEPVQIYPYATLLLPGSQNPLAITSTDKIALQPLRQCVLAARTAETIGHQHQHSIGKRESAGLLHTVCFWHQPIQNVLQTQFHSQRATSIGPQQAARVASMRSAQVAELPLVLLPPPSSLMRLSRCGARRSL